MYSLEEVRTVDPEIADLIVKEQERQNSHIELIASENWVSKAVMAAMGSVLTNKYAEGYPGKRFYGGCQWVDEVEALAIERAKKIFGCTYANVQPHSGAQANMAVFFALLKPGDTVMGMNLAHGGHLTHGSPANMSGAYFRIVPYGVNGDGVIDYDEVERLAKENRPKLIEAGARCYTYDNGFLHTKCLCVDGLVSCIGTANMDIRSFALNFEVNAVIYSARTTERLMEAFENDIPKSTLVTRKKYKQRSLMIRTKEQFCRLLSPVL